ncbi:hypothetical protein Patl1_33924 [Pistacia atlantica]|uniref:Uncharacterized protein n=1 Tax=Pistacia atlantica TaxID=434234 RepID=A0ACC0ZTD1_9ROSI|nr:hypothetical protein Patl1_33924 [Pistacia atlantica]
MAAGNPSSSVLVTLFIFVVVFSPMLPCEAARFTNGFHRHGLYCPQCVCCAAAKPGDRRLQQLGAGQPKRPVCLAYVCCTAALPGQCCRCCAVPIQTQSQNGSLGLYRL